MQKALKEKSAPRAVCNRGGTIQALIERCFGVMWAVLVGCALAIGSTNNISTSQTLLVGREGNVAEETIGTLTEFIE